MADEADIANDRADLERTLAVAGIIGSLYHGASAEECEECGDEIPEARRRALPGVKWCVGCAEITERRRRGYGRPVQYEEEEEA